MSSRNLVQQMMSYVIPKSWTLMFPVIIVSLSCLGFCSSSKNSGNRDSYVREACSVTQYPNLCINSLASFSRTARNNPSKWARAGVSVTIGEAKSVAQYLASFKKRNPLRGRNRAALLDCVECIQDSLDNLHRCLGVLRRLSSRTFDTQLGDVLTWLSAALTDDGTCLDGFDEEDREEQVVIGELQRRVLNVTKITSNALALVNRLATTGPEARS